MTVLERFQKFVDKESTFGCWLWTGSIDPCGYGRFGLLGKNRQAHRVALELRDRTIPEGLEVDHLCEVRNCVNPEHLQLVTHKDNVRLSHKRGRGYWVKQTHCIRGHPLSGDNLYINPRGFRRICKICRKMHKNTYLEKRNGLSFG